MNVAFVAELDDGRELGPSDITLHQEMIGMLCWATELGRVDVFHKISISSQHQASPRENHVKQLSQLFSHSERKCELTLCMDPNLPVVNESQFLHDTSEFLECKRDISSCSRDKCVALHHCCSVICDFTQDTNEQSPNPIFNELNSATRCELTSGSNEINRAK